RLPPRLDSVRLVGAEGQLDVRHAGIQQVTVADDRTAPLSCGARERRRARVTAGPGLRAVTLVDRAGVAADPPVAVAGRGIEVVADLVGHRVDVPPHGWIIDVEGPGEAAGEAVGDTPGGRLAAGPPGPGGVLERP